MNKRTIKARFNQVTKIRTEINALMEKAEAKRASIETILADLAKETCPYKRGQIFKRAGRQVWVKVKKVAPLNSKYGLPLKMFDAPYCLDCVRCNSKGAVVKENGNWYFIHGIEVGKEWTLVEE